MLDNALYSFVHRPLWALALATLLTTELYGMAVSCRRFEVPPSRAWQVVCVVDGQGGTRSESRPAATLGPEASCVFCFFQSSLGLLAVAEPLVLPPGPSTLAVPPAGPVGSSAAPTPRPARGPPMRRA